MNICETVDLLKKEQQFLQHEVAALKRRIGAALLKKRHGYPAESTNKLRSELSGNEARLADIVFMIEAAPDVEIELTLRNDRATEAPIGNMEFLRNEYILARNSFRDEFRGMRDDQPRLMSAALQVMKKARAARQVNDAKSFLNEYIRQKPIIGKTFQQVAQR